MSTATSLDHHRIKWKGTTGGATVVDLAQIFSSVNSFGRFLDEEVESQCVRLDNALTSIASNKLSNGVALHFILFPELTVPIRYLYEFLCGAQLQLEGGPTCVLVAGIEMTDRHNLDALLTRVSAKWEIGLRPEISSAGDHQPINSAVIAVFDEGRARLYFQVKFAASQFELSHDARINLFLASRVPVFSLGETEFLVALCSDWAVKKNDKTETISKQFVRHREKARPIRQALVFNIQMNPSMEGEVFAQSARNIFDSDLGVARSTVLFMCNAISAFSNGGSKILASKHLRIASPDLRRVSLYPADVSGLGLGVEAGALRLYLEAPTSAWQNSPSSPHQYSSSHIAFDVSRPDRGVVSLPVTVFAEPRGFLRSIEPSDKIGKRLSSMGHHDAAIALFSSIVKFHESSEDFFQVARFQYLIGTELRHQGRLNDAASWYSKAQESFERFVNRNSDNLNDHHKRFLGAIPAAQAILDVIWRGNQAEAVRFFSEAAKNCAMGKYGAKLSRRQDRASCHRQIAEAYRLQGNYHRATFLYGALAKFYGHVYPEDRSYAQLGLANSFRDAGDLEQARIIYEELARYVVANDANRFHARLLMALISYKLTAHENFELDLLQLSRIARENNLTFARVYSLLHLGFSTLKRSASGESVSVENAREAFREALDICQSKGVNGSFGRTIELEAAIAQLGISVLNQFVSGYKFVKHGTLDHLSNTFQRLHFAWGSQLTRELCIPRPMPEIVANMRGLP